MERTIRTNQIFSILICLGLLGASATIVLAKAGGYYDSAQTGCGNCHGSTATPSVIVTEFNYQTHFRDRTSNLESILARVQQLSDTRVIVFYYPEEAEQLAQLRQRFPHFEALVRPIEEEALRRCLEREG